LHVIQDAWLSLWGKKNLSATDRADARLQRETGPQTLVVYHGDLGSFSFRASEEEKSFAISHSRLMMQEQLLWRKNQGLSRTYESVDDLVGSLSQADNDRFLKAHAGIERPSDDGEIDPVTSAVYDVLSALRDR
jgi:hypothetical protein